MDPMQLRGLGAGLAGWEMGKEITQHARLERGGRNDSRMGGRAPDRRQGARSSRRSRRRFRSTWRTPKPAISRPRPSASDANCSKASCFHICESKGLRTAWRLERRYVAGLPQDVEIRRDVGGQAARIPARVSPVLRGVANGLSAIRRKPSSRPKSRGSQRCRSRTSNSTAHSRRPTN